MGIALVYRWTGRAFRGPRSSRALFYALHDTRTPVIVGTIAMSLNIVFSFAFSALFASLGWMPHGGLALAMSFETALEMSDSLY